MYKECHHIELERLSPHFLTHRGQIYTEYLSCQCKIFFLFQSEHRKYIFMTGNSREWKYHSSIITRETKNNNLILTRTNLLFLLSLFLTKTFDVIFLITDICPFPHGVPLLNKGGN